MLQRGNTLDQGKYQIIRKLGEGSYGIVYLADEVALDRPVALKIIRPEHLRSPAVAQAFNDEARLVAKLDHPHIVQIYGLEQEELGGQLFHYMVMPYMEEGDLQTVLSRGGQDFQQKLRWMCQIADGLAYAHRHLIMHRDLKPHNIFVHRQDIKIGDFSLARASGSARERSGLQGTVAYMSPEQIQGGCADFRSDIYALGVTYYQILTGGLPYDAEEIEAMFWQHVKAPVPSAQAVHPEVPHALDCLVQRMMAKNPASRPSADEVAKALSKLQDALHKPALQRQSWLKKLRATVSPESVMALLIGTVQKVGALLKQSLGRTKAVLLHRLPHHQHLVTCLVSAAVFLLLSGALFLGEWHPRSLQEKPPHDLQEAMRQAVEAILRAKGLTPCLQSELPPRCQMQVNVDPHGMVTLIGNVPDSERKQEVEDLVKKVRGVAAAQWRQPQPEEIRQWVETKLREERFLCLQRGQSPCLQVEVGENGVVHLRGTMCYSQNKAQVSTLIEGILGVTDVATNMSINTLESWGRVPRQCLARPWSNEERTL